MNPTPQWAQDALNAAGERFTRMPTKPDWADQKLDSGVTVHDEMCVALLAASGYKVERGYKLLTDLNQRPATEDDIATITDQSIRYTQYCQLYDFLMKDSFERAVEFLERYPYKVSTIQLEV